MSIEEARTLIYCHPLSPEDQAKADAINLWLRKGIEDNFGSMEHWMGLVATQVAEGWVMGEYPATPAESYPQKP
jgi:hypothetical protein